MPETAMDRFVVKAVAPIPDMPYGNTSSYTLAAWRASRRSAGTFG